MSRILLIILWLLPLLSYAVTIRVGKSYKYKTIKSGLRQAADGDTILIHDGTYREGNIVIEKIVCIIGVNEPVLDGEGMNEVVTVKSPGVTISGLKLVGSGKSSLEDLAAIKVLNGKNVTIRNNTLFANCFGIYLSNSTNCTISGNKIEASSLTQQSSGNGIHLWKCSNTTIEGNYIKGHRDGIYFEFVTNSLIKSNTSEGNLRYGLHFMFSHEDVYEGNTFRNNGAGVAVMYTRDVKMSRNHFELNWGAGAYAILLKDIRDSEITGNTFSGNTTGIYAESTNRVMIKGNTFSKNGWALRLTSSCDEITITGNNFIGNTFDMATNTTSSLTSNSYDGNYWDKYEGYDLDKDGKGDIPYYPVSLSTMLVEKIPLSVFFLHSFVLELIDKSEKVVPQLIPEGIRDNHPLRKRLTL